MTSGAIVMCDMLKVSISTHLLKASLNQAVRILQEPLSSLGVFEFEGLLRINQWESGLSERSQEERK